MHGLLSTAYPERSALVLQADPASGAPGASGEDGLLQAREISGGLTDGTEVAALLRLFKRSAWVEAGLTQDGKLQAMIMFNF